MNYESRGANGSQKHSCDDVRPFALSHDSFRASLHFAANHVFLRQIDRAVQCQEATKTG
jgi:hypothetical protein